MHDEVPRPLAEELDRFDAFLAEHLRPRLAAWERENRLPRRFIEAMARGGWLAARWQGGALANRGGLRETLLLERLAAVSPGVAVAVLIVSDLGLFALERYAGPGLVSSLGPEAAAGRQLVCIGSTENAAGSDAAGIAMRAEAVGGGWALHGAKAYVTNGSISDWAVVTAVTDPEAERSRRLSMFLVDLNASGVTRRRLNKRVWIPSDLSRIELDGVFVPDTGLLGVRGRGLSQLLEIFTHSRVPISGIALGTARGAFELGMARMARRRVFGRPLSSFQAKAFEAADLAARLEGARLAVRRAAEAMDAPGEVRHDAALAKYLSVDVAQKVAAWAADLFGAASAMGSHPVHKFPMDAWAVSLAEGTQDVQKLVLFRELAARYSKRA